MGFTGERRPRDSRHMIGIRVFPEKFRQPAGLGFIHLALGQRPYLLDIDGRGDFVAPRLVGPARHPTPPRFPASDRI